MIFNLDTGTLNIDNLTQRTVAIVGGKGTGKTTTVKLFLKWLGGIPGKESETRLNLPVLCFDPLGVIKTKASRGFILKVSRTKYEDAEIKKIASVINELLRRKAHVVISFNEKIRKEICEFTDALLPHITLRNGMLIVDEIHEFTPQNQGEGYSTEMERAVRHWRNRNNGVIITTQRPATVSKNVLALTDFLILYRVTWTNDLVAVEELLKRQMRDRAERDNFISELQKQGFCEGFRADFIEQTPMNAR